MASIDAYIDGLISRGRACFSRAEAEAALGSSSGALSAALARAIRRRRLARLRRDFFLVVRPEHWNVGGPDPVEWIDPLMRHERIDYRVSLLRAAAFHGSSHQASMVFQVVVPHQLRGIELGRHRVQFVFQSPSAFAQTNRPEWVGSIKSDAGFARVAGIELTLLDTVRYFRKAAGMDGAAQVVADIGGKARPSVLRQASEHYESTAVRRLGYLLELAGHGRQARALDGAVRRTKSVVPLNPSLRPGRSSRRHAPKVDARWKLLINDSPETVR
jgi:predicted transcriptional regulator of viral defense system